MSARKTLQIRRETADRFERFKRGRESQTDALARLLDGAGVPEILRCAECGDAVQAHARDDNGRIFCFECAGVSTAEIDR